MKYEPLNTQPKPSQPIQPVPAQSIIQIPPKPQSHILRWATIAVRVTAFLLIILVIGFFALLAGDFVKDTTAGKATAADFNRAVSSNVASVQGVSDSSVQCVLNSGGRYDYELIGTVSTTATTREELIDTAIRVIITLRHIRDASNSGHPEMCSKGSIYIKSADKQIIIGQTFPQINIEKDDAQIKSFVKDWGNTSLVSCTSDGKCTPICTYPTGCTQSDYEKLGRP
ncbi:MAG: hypothetical protein WBB94_03995 [Candidatus Saccharimonadaceae bacterium]